MDLRKNKGLSPVDSGFPISAITIDLTKRCNLACDYCNPAGTPILMADLTYKAIEDVKTGDKVIGFIKPEEKYKHTHFAVSTVEAKMERESVLVEVETTNGSFKCTPDHKWFNGRSYVPARVGMKIKYVSDPIFFRETEDYKIGYIHGIMAGDGTFSEGIHEYKSGPRRGKSTKYKHVRLALNDIEPLVRVERYMLGLGWQKMNWFSYTEKIKGLRTSIKELFDKLKGTPDKNSTRDYIIGWVAGVFDAEGSYDGYSLRISQKPGEVLEAIKHSLLSLGFGVGWIEHSNEVIEITINGGFSEHVKFFAMCNPAISRKKDRVLIDKGIYGESEVLEIKPASNATVYSMQTSTGNYIAHGHTSKNCFSHCFNKDRDKADLSVEMGKKIIDWVMRKEVRGDERRLNISFWGGEPLLKWDLMKELILYAEKKAKQNLVDVEFGGTTNVTLLTEDKLDFLDEHNCQFLLSIDGRPEKHNIHRKTIDGKGSYHLIDRNIDAILKKWPHSSVRLSHSVETIDDFLEDVKFLYNRGFRDIVYSPVSEGDWNEERLSVLESVWSDIADWFIETHKKGDPVKLKFLEDACGQYYGRHMGNMAPCGAGRGYIGITVDGSIYPCHRFNKFDDTRPWYEREVCLGHIDYGILNQDWRDNFIKWDINKDMCSDCKECDLLGIGCTGGCWASNWDIHGALSAKTEPGCRSSEVNLKLAERIDKELGENFKSRFVGRGYMNKGCICYNVCDQEGTPNERYTFNTNDTRSCVCDFATYTGDIKSECDCKSKECEQQSEKEALMVKIKKKEEEILKHLEDQELSILKGRLEVLEEIRGSLNVKND